MNKLHIISSVVAATLFVGCMTEAERIAYERQQKERREALQKQRAELLAKQKKEAAERRQKEEIAKREKYWEDIAEQNYNLIVEGLSYTAEEKVSRPKRERVREGAVGMAIVASLAKKVRLDRWLEPRNDIATDEKMKGRGLLETFGSRYMPNAYGRYEKCRDAAEEIQQMFNDSFPRPQEVKPKSPQWDAFCKMLKMFSKVRMKYLRAHDELCHYYVSYRAGAIDAEELARLDNGVISVRLLESNVAKLEFVPEELGENRVVSGETNAFATKYAPETAALYQKLSESREEATRILSEIKVEMRQMDVDRFEIGMIALCEKINYITRTMQVISMQLQAMHAEHKSMEKNAEAIAALDHELAMKWKGFVDALPRYVEARASSGVVDLSGIVEKWYKEDKLRLWQWDAVLGANKGDEREWQRSHSKIKLDDPFRIVEFGDYADGFQIDSTAGLVCRMDVPLFWSDIDKELLHYMTAKSGAFLGARLIQPIPNKPGYVNQINVGCIKGTDMFYGDREDVRLNSFRMAKILKYYKSPKGVVLYYDLSNAAIVVEGAKYKGTKKDQLGDFHDYVKVGDMAPSLIETLVNRHVGNEKVVKVTYVVSPKAGEKPYLKISEVK